MLNLETRIRNVLENSTEEQVNKILQDITKTAESENFNPKTIIPRLQIKLTIPKTSSYKNIPSDYTLDMGILHFMPSHFNNYLDTVKSLKLEKEVLIKHWTEQVHAKTDSANIAMLATMDFSSDKDFGQIRREQRNAALQEFLTTCKDDLIAAESENTSFIKFLLYRDNNGNYLGHHIAKLGDVNSFDGYIDVLEKLLEATPNALETFQNHFSERNNAIKDNKSILAYLCANPKMADNICRLFHSTLLNDEQRKGIIDNLASKPEVLAKLVSGCKDMYFFNKFIENFTAVHKDTVLFKGSYEKFFKELENKFNTFNLDNKIGLLKSYPVLAIIMPKYQGFDVFISMLQGLLKSEATKQDVFEILTQVQNSKNPPEIRLRKEYIELVKILITGQDAIKLTDDSLSKLLIVKSDAKDYTLNTRLNPKFAEHDAVQAYIDLLLSLKQKNNFLSKDKNIIADFVEKLIDRFSMFDSEEASSKNADLLFQLIDNDFLTKDQLETVKRVKKSVATQMVALDNKDLDKKIEIFENAINNEKHPLYIYMRLLQWEAVDNAIEKIDEFATKFKSFFFKEEKVENKIPEVNKKKEASKTVDEILKPELDKLKKLKKESKNEEEVKSIEYK